MGFGYKGDTGHHHTLGENAASLKKSFGFNPSSGYFGKPGKSNDKSKRKKENQRAIIKNNKKNHKKK